MSLDAMKQALEVLEEAVFYTSSESWSPSMTRECEAAITALRSAIEKAERPKKQDDRDWAAIPGTNVRVPIRHAKEQNK